MVKVKICCMASVEEARIAIESGASAVGLVSRMPSGPGPIEEELIAEIVATIPAGIQTFLLTCETTSTAISAQQQRTRANTLQLVDHVDPRVRSELRKALPHVKIVQVIHVRDHDSIDAAAAASETADAILLDSGNPSLAVKELGGTGRTHNWGISREIVEGVGVPVYLAGGLNASNVAQAVETVRPYAVDVCSGVRTDGKLDAKKLKAFMRALSSTP